MVNLSGREGTQSVLIKCTFRGLISGYAVVSMTLLNGSTQCMLLGTAFL